MTLLVLVQLSWLPAVIVGVLLGLRPCEPPAPAITVDRYGSTFVLDENGWTITPPSPTAVEDTREAAARFFS